MTVEEFLINSNSKDHPVEIVTYNGDAFNCLCINYNYRTHNYSFNDIPLSLRNREVLSTLTLENGNWLIEV